MKCYSRTSIELGNGKVLFAVCYHIFCLQSTHSILSSYLGIFYDGDATEKIRYQSLARGHLGSMICTFKSLARGFRVHLFLCSRFSTTYKVPRATPTFLQVLLLSLSQLLQIPTMKFQSTSNGVCCFYVVRHSTTVLYRSFYLLSVSNGQDGEIRFKGEPPNR